MKPCNKPWDQLTTDDKIETLHTELSNITKAINRMARAIMEMVDIQKKKDVNHG